LPYAPQTKTETKPRPNSSTATREISRTPTAPAGATSAGIPSFSIPSMPKTTRQLREQKNNPIVSKPVVTKKHEAIIPGKDTGATKDADLRSRFFAYLFDTVIHLMFWISITLIATVALKFEIDSTLITQNWGGFLMFFAFSQWFFIAMQETLFENSIGKALFGLEFRKNRKSLLTSSLFLRSIVFMIGALTLVGFFFRPQDQFAELQMKAK